MKIQHLIPLSLVIIIILAVSSPANGQSDNAPWLKAGGFIYNVFSPSKPSGWSLHGEVERKFSKSEFLTQGLRADHLKYGTSFQHTSLRYQLKFYPFYFVSRRAYKGFSVGLTPGYLINKTGGHRHGPVVGTVLGYQHLFGDRFSLGLEGTSSLMQNLNQEYPYSNASDRYLFFTTSIKLGIKL